jgi:hypothetical protein
MLSTPMLNLIIAVNPVARCYTTRVSSVLTVSASRDCLAHYHFRRAAVCHHTRRAIRVQDVLLLPLSFSLALLENPQSDCLQCVAMLGRSESLNVIIHHLLSRSVTAVTDLHFNSYSILTYTWLRGSATPQDLASNSHVLKHW